MINALFLRRYLKQQIDHLGYRPRRRKKHDAQNSEGNIEVLGSLRFRAAGFEFSFDDFVTNTVIFGQTGSGKTISILNTLLDGLIASSAKDELPISGIVLDAKGDFFGKLQNLCKRYGRENDLVILDPEAWKEHAETFKSIAWNPLDNDDDALEVATRLIAVLKMLGLEIGNEGTFFMDSAKAYLRHTIALIRAARLTPAPSLVDVYRLCQEDEKETPFYHEVIRAISARYPDEVPQTIKDAIIYMEKEWAPITDRQKSAIKGTLTQLLDEFLIAPLRDILTRPSTISIGDGIDTGKIFYIRIPVDDRTRMSRIVNTLLKLEYQRKVLQRRKKQRPSFMMCDEFQTLYTSGDGSGDSDFFERSRESNHANFVATQNLQAFLKRTRNDHDVKNFISNCALKIFLRNTDEETNRFASGLFGTRSEIVINTSEQAAFNGGWSKRRHTSYSRATRLLPCVSADAFMRLAIPVKSDPKNREAEAVVHLASRGETEHVTLFWPVHPLE